MYKTVEKICHHCNKSYLGSNNRKYCGYDCAKAARKKRVNLTCQLCGETKREILEAHHMKHKSKFPKLQFNFNNGITLCLKCHALQHMNDTKALRLINYKINKII